MNNYGKKIIIKRDNGILLKTIKVKSSYKGLHTVGAHLFADAFLFLSTSSIASCPPLSLSLFQCYLSSCFYSQPTRLLLFSSCWPPLCSLATFGWCTQSRC